MWYRPPVSNPVPVANNNISKAAKETIALKIECSYLPGKYSRLTEVCRTRREISARQESIRPPRLTSPTRGSDSKKAMFEVEIVQLDQSRDFFPNRKVENSTLRSVRFNEVHVPTGTVGLTQINYR
jgi:hypothetical protein